MKKIKKKKIEKKNFYSRAGQDGRLDEDKQTISFFGPNCITTFSTLVCEMITHCII